MNTQIARKVAAYFVYVAAFSLCGFYALVHAFFGIVSISHGASPTEAASHVESVMYYGLAAIVLFTLAGVLESVLDPS